MGLCFGLAEGWTGQSAGVRVSGERGGGGGRDLQPVRQRCAAFEGSKQGAALLRSHSRVCAVLCCVSEIRRQGLKQNSHQVPRPCLMLQAAALQTSDQVVLRGTSPGSAHASQGELRQSMSSASVS